VQSLYTKVFWPKLTLLASSYYYKKESIDTGPGAHISALRRCVGAFVGGYIGPSTCDDVGLC